MRAPVGVPALTGNGSTSLAVRAVTYRESHGQPRHEVREFLASRRARITPEQAGLPAYGGNRRVKGLRREEVALLAGVSIDYYIRMERGDLAGASEAVLDGVANALQLDEAEREHLRALARAAGPDRDAPDPTQARPRFAQSSSRFSTRSPKRRPGSATPATTSSP